jgi:glycosyltransferase involved in cell wall biosynthesis
MVRRIEARRTRRDEARVVAGARSSAVFDETERVQLIAATHREVRRLDLILPPAKPSPLEGCVAVFVGDRQWAPNAEAHRELVDLWPLIAGRSPGSHLLIVGRPSPGERRLERADVTYAGFVDDIEAVWHRASLLLAPVSTGGGVRVKVLEAAAHGVPVVGYPSALGSIPAYLNIAPVASSAAFVDRAATLLGDQVLLSAVGSALHEEVSALWRAGFVQEQIISWLELN